MYNHVPEYYHGMARDGYNYHEVIYAWKNKVMKQKELNATVSQELRQAMKEIHDSLQ